MVKTHQRKIQSFARYSYAVTLPKHWIMKNNLDRTKNKTNSSKNSQEELPEKKEPEVNIYEMPDGSLKIFPLGKEQKTEEEIQMIDLDELIKENPRFLEDKAIQMILISYYMNGAIGVEINSKKTIPKEIIEQIERTQQRLLFNWNYNRISNHKVLIKNIFKESPENIFQEDIPRYLRESFSILLWIIEDIQTALEEDDYTNLDKIPERDNKIDRYYFFIVRQIRTIFENPQFSKPLNYSHKKLVDLRLLSKLIEDVGDKLKESAQILFDLKTFVNEVQMKPYLIEYFKTIFDVYSIISDFVKVSVQLQAPTIGMNQKMMKTIETFRVEGKKLENKWKEIVPKIVFDQKKYHFYDYYQGSKLINYLEDIFLMVYDFTNLFF
jgi:phosphate uptake regulator